MPNTTAPISIDTNVVLRLCVGDVPAQVAAANRLLAGAALVYIDDVAVIEAVYVMNRSYDFSREATAETLLALLTQPNVQCRLAELQQALHYFCQHPALSFEDCYLAVQARANQAVPLYTFDRKLANQLQHADLLKV